MQIADKVPESCGADCRQGFRCRWLMKFQRVAVQIAQGCGGFRCRWLMKFWRVRVQIANKVPEVPMQMADEVSNGLVQTRFWGVPDG